MLQINTPAAPTANNPTIVTPDANTTAEDSVAAGNTANLNGIGTLVINPDGSYVFTPDANWNGNAPQVTYTTNTGASSTLNITVTPVNNKPIDGNEAHVLSEDSRTYVAVGNALTNASDVDGDPLTISAGAGETKGSYGTLTLGSNREYTYTLDNASAVVQSLNAGDTVQDTFTYTVSDGNGGTTNSTITIRIVGADDNAHVTVSAEGADSTVYERGLTSVGDTSETNGGSSRCQPAMALNGWYDLQSGAVTGCQLSGGAHREYRRRHFDHYRLQQCG